MLNEVRPPLQSPAPSQRIELSIVLPCLNEAETLGVCIEKALRALRENGIAGEVIVADNGSTDGSIEIARDSGARVVPVAEIGYGSALIGGIAAARGKYILMGDADDSYDFLEAPKFLEKLREGYELVQGCRLSSGGGVVAPEAMPLSHRWVGNPGFSLMTRIMFKTPIHDVHCGLRAFTKDLYGRLDQRCTGMEFASEMIVKSTIQGARIAEIPITLHKDGRITRRPHLRTIRDGWRHLRFLLMLSPRWLFLYPGALLILFGLAGAAVAFPATVVNGIHFDVHTLLFAALAVLLGYQSILFAIFAKTFAISERLLPQTPRMNYLFKVLNLERGLLAGALCMAAGVALLLGAWHQWRAVHFGPLDYRRTMRWVIPGMTLTALGFQTILSSFFMSILGMRRK
jgi:glycosyltransferase involved in cell wall biosynthesis